MLPRKDDKNTNVPSLTDAKASIFCYYASNFMIIDDITIN